MPRGEPAAGGQQCPVGRAGRGGRRGGGGGGGFLPEDAVASLLALQQAALARSPVLEAAVGRQAASPRRAARRRGVAEQFPAEAQDVLHVEVFPAGAGHGAAAGGGRARAEAGLTAARQGQAAAVAAARGGPAPAAAAAPPGSAGLAGRGVAAAGRREMCAHTSAERERGWMERCTEPRGGRDTQQEREKGRDAQS